MADIYIQGSIFRNCGKQIEIAQRPTGIDVLSQILAVDKSEIHILLLDGDGNKYTIDWVGSAEHADWEPKAI